MPPLERRVCGLETEYGLSVQVATQKAGARPWRRVSSDEAATMLFRPITQELGSTNVFLRNGGRIYLDVGSHPEYATAECARIADLIAQDRAGDLIINRLADRALEQLAEDGIEARVQILKNNVDSHGNSYGSHENYQVKRDRTLRTFAGALTGFLVSRQLLCGAGRLVNGEFRLSQRADHMWDPLSSTTTRARPMINTRDEPHADPKENRRLHIIVGDSNLAEQTLIVRMGATELMLRAIEDGHDFAEWMPTDPGAAIRAVAMRPDGRAPIELVDGSTTTALDMLEAMHEVCADYSRGDSVLRGALSLWAEIVTAVADGRPELIDMKIDWAIKKRLLDSYADRHDLRPADPRLAQLDLAFHDIRPGQGLFTKLEAAGQIGRVIPEHVFARAVDEPPVGTRAQLRGKLITAAQKHHRQYTCDWMNFDVRDLDDGHLTMADPLKSDDARVDELIERMGTEPRRSQSSTFSWPPTP